MSVYNNGVAFTSSGTVEVSAGTFRLDDPGGTDSGSFTVAAGAMLDFGETTTTLSSQSSVSGDGTVIFDKNDTATVDGAYNLGSLDDIVYATADAPGSNGPPFHLPPTYSFGTVDLTTGQWTPIATTSLLINSLTAGPAGTLYAGPAQPNPNLYTISPSGATSQVGTVSAPAGSYGFVGLASEGAAGFWANSVTPNGDSTFTDVLDHISADGSTLTVIGTMGASFGSSNTGDLAFGPDGKLYFDTETMSKTPTLYAVNTTTGAVTAVGSGLNEANPLTLVLSGTTLYGIDTYTQTNPAIYTIDTTTGVATQIATVSGANLDFDEFYLDTVAPHPAELTPESSTEVQSSAVVDFDNNVTSFGANLNVLGGTANLESNSVNVLNLEIESATLTGTGTVTVTGGLTWGGTMAGTGQTIAQGTTVIQGGILDTRSFTSDGTTTLVGNLSFENGAVFTNAATSTFYDQENASLIKGDSSSPAFFNAGSFNVLNNLPYPTDDYPAKDNGVDFTNTGPLNVTGGVLSLIDLTLTNQSVINQSGSTMLQIGSGATLNNTSSGTYTLSAGTLQVDGTFITGRAVTVPAGAILQGVGTISGTVNVQAGADLAPGDVTDDGGALSAASTTLTAASNFDVDLNGTTAGAQYDQLNATGTVNLAGAKLNLAGTFTSALGDVFTIVKAASVTGTFDGLPQNTSIPLNGRALVVSYTPGTVTLTDTFVVTVTPTIAWPAPDPIVYGTPLTRPSSTRKLPPTGSSSRAHTPTRRLRVAF